MEQLWIVLQLFNKYTNIFILNSYSPDAFDFPWQIYHYAILYYQIISAADSLRSLYIYLKKTINIPNSTKIKTVF